MGTVSKILCVSKIFFQLSVVYKILCQRKSQELYVVLLLLNLSLHTDYRFPLKSQVPAFSIVCQNLCSPVKCFLSLSHITDSSFPPISAEHLSVSTFYISSSAFTCLSNFIILIRNTSTFSLSSFPLRS